MGQGNWCAIYCWTSGGCSFGVRGLVTAIEQSIIQLIKFLRGYRRIKVLRRQVFTSMARKLAALGLRIRKGCSYHGLSLNVDMDLDPFLNINPCGFKGLEVVDMKASWN